MRTLARKIKDLRKGLGLRQPEFAKVVGGVDQSTISKWENALQKPRPEHVVRLAELANVTPQQLLNIPVVDAPPRDDRYVRVTGAVQAGAWAEAMDWPEDDQYDVPPPPPSEWDNYPMHARLVTGPSMNRYYPDGSIVYVCPISALGRAPKSGEKVVVQRVDEHGTYEVTLKEYVVDDDGKVWLWPRSNHPEHQAPLRYVESRRRIDHVMIVGIVIASLTLEAHRV